MFYVYHLIDPRDGEPFYVGKGKRDRIEAHEKEARLDPEHWDNPAKCNRIREIWAAGLQVTRQRIKFFHKERDALAFEFAQIISLKGLTNIVRSPQGSRRYVAPQPKVSRLKFTEDRIARIAWVAAVSNGLQNEFTIERPGATGVLKAIADCVNAFGNVRMARETIATWMRQRGFETVVERFKPYGIDLSGSVFAAN